MHVQTAHVRQEAGGFIRRWPAGLKVVLAVGLIISAVIIPPARALWLAGPGAAVVLLMLISRPRWGMLLRRLVVLEPMVIVVSLMALAGPGGWRMFLYLVAKSTTCVVSALWLGQVTTPSQLLNVLRRCRVPGILVTTLSLMYRYLFVMADEVQRMKRARASRTLVRRRWQAWRLMSTIIAQLFVRASERAERIYAAMLARGWR